MKKESLALLIFIGFCVIGKSQSVPSSIFPSDTLVIASMDAWTRTHYHERINEFKNNMLQKRDIVFLGNSLTEKGGSWNVRFNSSVVKNRGIAGDVTEGVLYRLGEIGYFKPTSVFILIGINDLMRDKTPEYVTGNIFKIVRNIRH